MSDMLNSIAHRGPDDNFAASIESYNGVMGHRRLRIVDMHPRSSQPFWSYDKRFVLVFNGEIYNYKLLKKELEEDGIAFATTSDTEVLLYWLIKNGAQCLNELDGMYAFTILDLKRGLLVSARDPFGEKPFYYTYEGGMKNFAFCSEIKGLLKLPYVDKTLDPVGLGDYLRFLYTAPPHTFYKGIMELPPGHVLYLDLKKFNVKIKEFYNIEKQSKIYGSNPYVGFRDILQNSVKSRLQSDVPVCIYLSGGMDSNAIMACAKEVEPEKEFQTFTISYSDSDIANQLDESSLAQKSAKYFEANCNIVNLKYEVEIECLLNRIVDIFDQPFGNSTAIVSDMLARSVSSEFRVALVGDGGDEIAVGYPRYRALKAHQKALLLPLSIRLMLSNVLNSLPVYERYQNFIRRVHQFSNGICKKPSDAFLNWSSYLNEEDIATAFGSEKKSEFKEGLSALFERNQSNLLRAASMVDFKSFVPFNLMQCADRTSMIHSLELRSPFLSKDIVKYALSVDENIRFKKGELKPLIKRGLYDIVPDFILNQPKRPFNPPIYEFLKDNFSFMERYLVGGSSQLKTIISTSFVKKQLDDFRTAKKENATLLWAIAILECWLRKK